MAKFEFKKSALMSCILAKHKFEDIDEAAYVKILTTIEILVFNLLNNVLYIVKSLNLKTITKKHCFAVLQIMKDYENGKEIMKGGSLVMPTEYYGLESGRYFDADVVAAIENNPWADPGLTRTALDATFGGAKEAFVTKTHVKALIEKYKQSEKEDFKVAANVYEIIISCIMSNLDVLFTSCRKNNKDKKRVTIAVLYGTLKKQPKQFAHMSYILK